MTNILSSEQAIKKEWDRIITMARNNGFSDSPNTQVEKQNHNEKSQYHIYTEKRAQQQQMDYLHLSQPCHT